MFELFQLVYCVLVFGIEFEALAIVGDSLLFLTVLGIGFSQAVIDVARFGILLDIEFEDCDGIGIPVIFEEPVHLLGSQGETSIFWLPAQTEYRVDGNAECMRQL